MTAGAAPKEHHGVRDVKSGARTVELLELLASRQNRPTTIRELSAAMDIPRSSLYALLRTLVGHGWVRSDPTGSVYMIGIRALLAGTSYLDTDAYLRVVQPYLDDLHARFDETFHFGRLDGFDVVYLATRESSQYQRSFSRVGRRLPAYSTALGKALLADRTGADRAAHIPARLEPLTPATLTDRSALEADLRARPRARLRRRRRREHGGADLFRGRARILRTGRGCPQRVDSDVSGHVGATVRDLVRASGGRPADLRHRRADQRGGLVLTGTLRESSSRTGQMGAHGRGRGPAVLPFNPRVDRLVFEHHALEMRVASRLARRLHPGLRHGDHRRPERGEQFGKVSISTGRGDRQVEAEVGVERRARFAPAVAEGFQRAGDRGQLRRRTARCRQRRRLDFQSGSKLKQLHPVRDGAHPMRIRAEGLIAGPHSTNVPLP